MATFTTDPSPVNSLSDYFLLMWNDNNYIFSSDTMYYLYLNNITVSKNLGNNTNSIIFNTVGQFNGNYTVKVSSRSTTYNMTASDQLLVP